MKDSWKRTGAGLVSFTLVLFLLIACGDESGGKQLVTDRCLTCHSISPIEKGGKSADQWRVTVERMVLRGADLDDTEQELLIQYLANTYP